MIKLLIMAPIMLAAAAQSPSPSSPHLLTVHVDGSRTPDRIPDDLAYEHFILAVSEHQSPSPIESRRREAQLNPIGLSSADHDAFLFALSGVREELDAIQTARDAVSLTPGDSAAEARLKSLLTDQKQLIARSRAGLKGAISVDGQAKLDVYIRSHVKKHIVLLGN